MGVHTGVAELRDGDYFGVSLNRAARIMSAAPGEQILLSVATAELLRGQLPAGVTLREMGEHRLKGLLNPERILQVVAPGLRAEFPPLASLTGHNLAAERDAFVGRSESLDDLKQRLDDGARLISVVGLGGTGKTRLVTRFAWTVLGQFPGGVWFCDLSESADDKAAIAVLMNLLEGIPLAIELAAARVRVMSPRTLLSRMSERFKLLSSSGGRVDRQATLRAVFDWSWDLLSLPEQAALAQLSVFEGGFTLEAVEGVLDLSRYDEAPWPVDVLQSLVQKSLVREVDADRLGRCVRHREHPGASLGEAEVERSYHSRH